MIAAKREKIPLTFKMATSLDLAGRDIFEAVMYCVEPTVIQTPLVASKAKNGIQVKAIARITVKADINKLLGGATEETILARVGEAIFNIIVSAKTHEEVLENSDLVSKAIQDQGLDEDAAFEIISVEVEFQT